MTAGKDNRPWFTPNDDFRLTSGLYGYKVIGSVISLLPRPAIQWLARRLASGHNVMQPLTDN